MSCKYPGCQKPIAVWVEAPTIWERLTEEYPPFGGLCQEHAIFEHIDMEKYEKATMNERFIMEIHALEDARCFAAFDSAIKSMQKDGSV